MGDVVPLGSRLRQRREELGLSQAQAAKQLDVARTAYRLWEMEAAKPAPDRWRAIARWLGISMTAMLVAEELIDQQEALEASRAAARAGLTDTQRDDESAEAAGDYFEQQRAMISGQERLANISTAEAARLNRALLRLQAATSSDARATWHPGEFRKRLPNNTLAPALSRAALATTAVGVSAKDFQTGALLTSELVTNSVRHSESDWIDIAIKLTPGTLRIEVCDEDPRALRPRTPSVDGGLGLRLISELATRWGVERHGGGKAVWVELDLAA